MSYTEYSSKEQGAINRASRLHGLMVDLKYPDDENYKLEDTEAKFKKLLTKVQEDLIQYPALKNPIMHEVREAYKKSLEIGKGEITGSYSKGREVRVELLRAFPELRSSSSLCLRCKALV